MKQGLASTNRELTKWHRDGITEAELDYRKSALAGAHRVSLATSGGLAEVILSTVRRGLELSWIDEYPKKVAALSLKQVNGTIRRYVDPATSSWSCERVRLRKSNLACCSALIEHWSSEGVWPFLAILQHHWNRLE